MKPSFLCTWLRYCILLILFSGSALGQVQNLAIVVNALTLPELGITPSLSMIDLTESNAKRAVNNEILPLGNTPSALLIHGHLAYIPNVFSDNILIINLQHREIVGRILLGAGAQPQQLAFVDSHRMYVTCDAVNEVRVIDVTNRSVVKTIKSSFNKPTGITVLNGKAYITNPAWESDAASEKVTYHDSSVTVIDTETDTVLKSIGVPTNAVGILNDGENTVIVKTTGDYNLIPGNLVLIDAATDEIRKTVPLRLTPGSFAINSEGKLFIQGGWFNPVLLIYDLVREKWIRDKADALVDFGGGSGMDFAMDGNLYITYPDWSGGGQDVIRVMGPDETLRETYRVGRGASIVKIAQIVPRAEDINDDGFVNIADVVLLSSYIGERGDGIRGDVNMDGVVNILDVVFVSKSF